jgi:hypothetical protein
MLLARRDVGAGSSAPAGAAMTTLSGALPPAPRVFRPPLAARLLSLFGFVILACVTAIMTVFAVLGFSMHWALGVFMTALAVFIGALTGYVWRDLSGKWSFWIRLDASAVEMNLPAGRSLIHRPPSRHLVVPYADIAAIDTRLEAYGSLGMEMMQRSYVLRRKNGDLIFLFEDRALAAGLAKPMFAEIASELAARAGVQMHDLGMVEGKGGVLGVWGTHAPNWAAPSLPLARQMQLWRHSAYTGALTLAVIIIAFAIRMILGG